MCSISWPSRIQWHSRVPTIKRLHSQSPVWDSRSNSRRFQVSVGPRITLILAQSRTQTPWTNQLPVTVRNLNHKNLSHWILWNHHRPWTNLQWWQKRKSLYWNCQKISAIQSAKSHWPRASTKDQYKVHPYSVQETTSSNNHSKA